jgi:hypothetical protein
MAGKRMKFFASLMGLFLSISLAWASDPVLDATRITAKEDLPGLSLSEQRELLRALQKNNGPFGKNLAAYFLPKDLPDLAWIARPMLDRLNRMNVSGSQSNCYWTSHFALGILSLPAPI